MGFQVVSIIQDNMTRLHPDGWVRSDTTCTTMATAVTCTVDIQTVHRQPVFTVKSHTEIGSASAWLGKLPVPVQSRD